MSLSRKYGRTYHFPFSEGTTNDDRINHNYWKYLKDSNNGGNEYVILEKLDGQNNCISKLGVFARSHATITTLPWDGHLKEKRDILLNDLINEDIEIFGENMYAIHSIGYNNLESHFYVFGIRRGETWLSWEEVEEYCYILGLVTVPVISVININDFETEKEFEEHIMNICKGNLY